MPAKLFKLECITNLHVGNGDVNYNIIDNEVERDPVTNYPVIHSSGVKGAFREYFTCHSENKPEIEKLFGSAQGGNVPGALKFLQAELLSRPVRASAGSEAFYYVATQRQVDLLCEKCEMLEDQPIKFERKKDQEEKAQAEGIDLKDYWEIFDKKVYCLDENNYQGIDLPVMARNHLENGISQNLWYEEVVPHHSIFTFYVLADNQEQLDVFADKVEGKVVQLGGGATIGYGLCKVSFVEGLPGEEKKG